jgi:hypothetical protein
VGLHLLEGHFQLPGEPQGLLEGLARRAPPRTGELELALAQVRDGREQEEDAALLAARAEAERW